MKTAVALFAAALSVAALSTNASAQKMMPTAGMKAPKLVANVSGPSGPGAATFMTGGGGKPSDNVGTYSGPGGTTFMTGGASGTSWREVNGLPSPATFLNGGADTSFGTRSGGGFKLASETDEANPNDSPGPKPEKIMRPTTGLLFASFITGSASPGGDDIYTSAKIGGSASPGGDDAYALIGSANPGGDDVYTSAKIGGSADPGGDDV